VGPNIGPGLPPIRDGPSIGLYKGTPDAK
jgi:hypothetical protein